MEEKDKQIAELKKQLNEHEVKISSEVSKQFQQQTENLDTKLQQIAQAHQDGMTKLQATVELLLGGFTCHEFTLAKFKEHQANGPHCSWYSDPFNSGLGRYRFKLNIDTRTYGTHLGAYLYLLPGAYDKDLQWPVKVTTHLIMLNQRGDHNHHECTQSMEYETATRSTRGVYKVIDCYFFSLTDLTYNAQRNIEFLQHDTIKFKLNLKIH